MLTFCVYNIYVVYLSEREYKNDDTNTFLFSSLFTPIILIRLSRLISRFLGILDMKYIFSLILYKL